MSKVLQAEIVQKVNHIIAILCSRGNGVLKGHCLSTAGWTTEGNSLYMSANSNFNYLEGKLYDKIA